MKIIDQIRVEKKLFKEALFFWLKLRKYNASVFTGLDIEKTQYVLLRKTHTIEKGLSMRNPRKGFGQQKVKGLIDELIAYNEKYGKDDKSFLQYPINTINAYIQYSKRNNVEINEIEMNFTLLTQQSCVRPIDSSSGVITYFKDDILSKKDSCFRDLLNSRHSIRYFKKEVPSKDIIDEALKMASKTPSACNRQGWKTHVFLGDKSVQLVKWQSGARGFEDEIKGAILVTANLKAFLFYEVHQAYIDGGLYAMNLINALHSLGLGVIPLSVGFECSKLSTLKQFNIPNNEVPIVIIGFGYMEDMFNAALSERKDIRLTNTYH